MTILIVVFALFSSRWSLADVVTCPTHISQNPKYESIVEFLRPLQGHFHVGSCKVELHICADPAAGSPPRLNDSVGDLLITSASGRETYMTFYLPKINSPKVTTQLRLSPLVLHYEFEDLVGDPVNGHMKSYKVEFILNPKTHKIQTLTMGTYSTNEARPHMNQYTFIWNTCGLGEE